MSETAQPDSLQFTDLQKPKIDRLPQHEKKEIPHIVSVLQKGFQRWEEDFDKKREEKTLSEEDRVNWVTANIPFQKTDRGTKLDVVSLGRKDGKRLTVRQSVPVDGLLDFYTQKINQEQDEKVKAILQEEHDTISTNSRDWLRTDNRKGLAEAAIAQMATSMARAVTGLDSDAWKFRARAAQSVRNGREFFVPNAKFQASVEDTLVTEKTLPEVSEDYSFPRVSDREPTGTNRVDRTPQQEIQFRSRQDDALRSSVDQLNHRTEAIIHQSEGQKLAAELRQSGDAIRAAAGRLDVGERSARMQETNAALLEAVRKLDTVQPEEVPVAEVGAAQDSPDAIDPLSITNTYPEDGDTEEVETDVTVSKPVEMNVLEPVAPEISLTTPKLFPDSVTAEPVTATSLFLRTSSEKPNPEPTPQDYIRVHNQNTEDWRNSTRALPFQKRVESSSSQPTPLHPNPAERVSILGRLSRFFGRNAKAA